MTASTRKLFLAALFPLALSFSACFKSREFHIEGMITIAPFLQKKLPDHNVSLFIIAKDQGGVPIAVKRIVDPQFPLFYSLGPDDFLLPGMKPQGLFSVIVEVNTTGHIGKPAKGDMEGSSVDVVSSPAKNLSIVIDRRVAGPR